MNIPVKPKPSAVVWENEPTEEQVVEVEFPLEPDDIPLLEINSEVAFANIAHRSANPAYKRKTEVRVSQLNASRKKELVGAKDKEISSWLKHKVVEAASRSGIPPSALMRMRWVITVKPDNP